MPPSRPSWLSESVVTRTFLLTDIAGSARAWDRAPEAMAHAVADHETIIERVVTAAGGRMIKRRGEGDSTFSVFDHAADAAAAALGIQHGFAAHAWPTDEPISVRIAVHTGRAEARNDDYFGPTVNRAGRLRGLCAGGQVLLSDAAAAQAGGRLPADSTTMDLGVHRLRDLSEPERVFQLCHPDLHRDFPPRIGDAARGNVPPARDRFVGRANELARVTKSIETGRLVTLLGAGGVGKTRLAREVAEVLARDLPGGAWFVELAAAAPGAVAAEIGRSIGMPAATDSATIASSLGTQPALVVLDNCEHLVEECATVADGLLEAGRSITILATSRAPLGAAGELVQAIDPLPLSADGAAAALFMDRAGIGSDADPATRSTVARICAQVDGLPLAIEVVAARVGTLGLAGVEELLAEGVGALGASSAHRTGRRTMEATVRWSYDLLDEEHRRCFERLSVFAGGFTLAAAERVCAVGDVDDASVRPAVLALAERSLISADPGAVLRFKMLEPVREVAAQWLADFGAAEAEVRHLRWVRDITAAAATLEHAWSEDTHAMLGRERGNIAAAVARARTPSACADAAVVLANLLSWSGFGSIGGDVDYVVGHAQPADDEAAAVLQFWSVLDACWGKCSLEEARLRFDAALEAVAAPGFDERYRRRLLAQLSELALGLGLGEQAIALCQQGLAAADEAGNRFEAFAFAANRGAALRILGRDEEARGAAEAAITRFQRAIAAGVPIEAPIEDDCIAIGRPESAPLLLSEALDAARRRGDGAGTVSAAFVLASAHLAAGRLDAVELTIDEMRGRPESRWRYFAGGIASIAAATASLRGNHDEARAVLAAVADPGGWASDLALQAAWVEVRAGCVGRARSVLDEAFGADMPTDGRVVDVLLAEGRLDDAEEAIVAREGRSGAAGQRANAVQRASLHRRRGQLESARLHAARAARLGVEHRAPLTLMEGLRELALSTELVSASDAEAAARALGAAVELHDRLGIAPGTLEGEEMDRLRETLIAALGRNPAAAQSDAPARLHEAMAAGSSAVDEVDGCLPQLLSPALLAASQPPPGVTSRETCRECGFDANEWSPGRATAEPQSLAERWRDALVGPTVDRLRERPKPEVWSAVEYTVHTAEVVRLWNDALVSVLNGDVVAYDANGYPDADRLPYNEVAPADAVASLVAELDRLAALGQSLSHTDRQTTLRISDPVAQWELAQAGITDVFAGYLHALHDASHHLGDVERGLA